MLSEISERSFSSCSCMRYPRGLLRLELLRLSDGEHVASGLYLDHYQSHIILLRATVHEGRNLVHDALKNLLGRPPSTRAKELFQALLTPQFTLTVCCFCDSVSAGHHDIAILKLKRLRIVAGVCEHSDRRGSGL